jgi:hypothetical protein
MTEYVVDFGDEKSSAFVRLAMAQAESNGARLCEEIVRCRDCRYATISSLGLCKYCEKFVLPDQDGYGPDPQVNLPLDFFCAYGELRDG